MPFKDALWAAGFPEVEDAIIGASTNGATYFTVPGLPGRVMAGSFDISEHGTGALRVTAKPGVNVLRAEVSIDDGNVPAAAELEGQDLTVEVVTTTNLGAIKALIDGLAGAPFTTAYVGGARASDAINGGTFNYVFGPRVNGQPLMVELTSTRDCYVHRGPAAPADDTASVLVPQDGTLRFELRPNEDIRVKRIGSNNAVFSLRCWRRV